MHADTGIQPEPLRPPANITLDMKQGQTFCLDDGQYRFGQELTGANLLMQRLDTGLNRIISERDLVDMLSAGRAHRIQTAIDRAGKIKKIYDGEELGPDEQDTPRALEARSKQFMAKRFDSEGKYTKSRASISKLIDDCEEELKTRGLPHDIPTHRMVRALRNCGSPGDRKLRYFLSRRGKLKRSRLPEKVEEMLESSVSFFWDLRSRNYSDAFGFFHGLLAEENAVRKKNGEKQLKPPERMETLRRRINAAMCRDNWARKYSPLEADQKFRGVAEHMSAAAPGELVVIDHTVVDAFTLLDRDTGLPLGRPYLSVAIDVATRCILGFLVSAEPPSVYSVMTLLKRVNRDKNYVADLYPDIDGKWDSWIHPVALLLDNAWEFSAPSTRDALSDMGTEVIWAPIGNPQYKAIGERFFHTFNTMLAHRLRGGVAGDITDRRRMRLDPSKDAVFTVQDLDHLITRMVIVYENERHEGVGGIPARLWQEGIQHYGRRFIDDITALDAVAGKVVDVTLTRAGVKFKNMKFHDRDATSRLLDELLHAAAKRSQSSKPYASGRIKVKAKYNPADASEIHVFNEERREYVTLPNRDQSFCAGGLSFWAAQQIYEYAKEKDLAFQSDHQRWLARNELRKSYERFLPSAPLKVTKKARRALAQEKPTLEDVRVTHTTAPPQLDGRGQPGNIPVEMLMTTRRDGDQSPKGVLKNPAKADATRKRNKKLKATQAEADRKDAADLGEQTENPKKVQLVLPTISTGSWHRSLVASDDTE